MSALDILAPNNESFSILELIFIPFQNFLFVDGVNGAKFTGLHIIFPLIFSFPLTSISTSPILSPLASTYPIITLVAGSIFKTTPGLTITFCDKKTDPLQVVFELIINWLNAGNVTSAINAVNSFVFMILYWLLLELIFQ